MAITLTEAAASRVRRYIEKRGKGVGLRVGVKKTGCSGLAYVVDYADDVRAGDTVFEDKGIKVVINPDSVSYLDGAVVDFAREGFNESFRFTNPNEKDRCGCGESFHV
ncbi:MAG: iron-sulfur cluster assembly protein IscA [Gammaproteobacteria bacterium]|nr:iron-sulfur cluster assembly protein IscA [Gammaproteobacteria bacterium]MBA3731177.1 iron-sulfur cluster assembly protein IscA [Gammaproteobacteria bacterium]